VAEHPEKVILATQRAKWHWPHFVPYWLAREQGIYKEEGLPDVDQMDTGDWGPMLEGLLDGSIHFGVDMSTGFVLRQRSQGADIAIIAGARNRSNDVLVGGKGIRSVQDLRGKNVPILRQGVGFPHLCRILEEAGLKPDVDVMLGEDTARGGTAEHYRLLREGKMPAAFVAFHNAEKLRAEGHVWLVNLREVVPDYADRVMVTSGRMIREHPETVKAAIKAIVRGYRAERDQEAVRQVVAKEGFLDGFFDDTYETHAYRLAMDGGITRQALQVVIDEEKRFGRLAASFGQEDVVRAEYLVAAQRELGLPVNV